MSHSIVSFDSFKEVVIYGYSKTRADLVKVWAHESVAHVYEYNTPSKPVATLSGRTFIKLPYSLSTIPTLCKNTLVAIVIENYLRKSESLPIISVIFCLESSDCPPRPTAWIANKNLDTSGLGRISNAELRRMYKLCSDPELSSEVKEMAKATFKFVRVRMPGLELEEIPAPWEKEPQVWIKAWEQKKSGKSKSKSVPTKLNWRGLLVDPSKAHEKMLDPRKPEKQIPSSCCLVQ